VHSGIKPQEIPKALYSDNSSQHCILLRQRLLKKHLQCLPYTSTQFRSEKAILPFKGLFIDLFKCFKMIFDTPIIGGIPRIARPVDRRNVGYGLIPPCG
jgi:hypothetical protein